MTNRWLRNKIDGTIYGWDPYIARNPKVEEVTEQEAFPERFIPAHIKERVELSPERVTRRRRRHVDISTVEEVPEAVASLNAELSADASRGLE
jgi:hypothetical protein